MENIATITNNIPKWFWIALGLIIVSTVIAILYCNYKTNRIASSVAVTVKEEIDNSPLSEPMKVLIKEEVKSNIIELFPDLTSVLHN